MQRMAWHQTSFAPSYKVLNVVNAVFVQQTMKTASSDEELAFKQKEKDDWDHEDRSPTGIHAFVLCHVLSWLLLWVRTQHRTSEKLSILAIFAVFFARWPACDRDTTQPRKLFQTVDASGDGAINLQDS